MVECISGRVSDLIRQLYILSRKFQPYSIAVVDSTDVIVTAQFAVFLSGSKSNLVLTKESMELIPVCGTTVCEVSVYEYKKVFLENVNNLYC